MVPYIDEAFGKAIDDMFGQPFDLLLGRRTYDIFAAHWPYVEDGNYNLIEKRFNSSRSTSRLARPWR